MRRFRCDAIPEPGTEVELSADVSHHVLQVTKVRRGARLMLFDGSGATAVAELRGARRGHAVVHIESVRAQPVTDIPTLHACLAVTKGSHFELSVRMAVELGATEVWPVLAKRSVARGDRAARWMRVVEGAVGQSGRVDLPTLHPLAPLAEVLRSERWTEVPVRWIGVPGAGHLPGTRGPAAVLIGPEGGWTDAEVDRARAAGWQAAGLGSRVLRAETAVAAALTRLRCAGPATG